VKLKLCNIFTGKAPRRRHKSRQPRVYRGSTFKINDISEYQGSGGFYRVFITPKHLLENESATRATYPYYRHTCWGRCCRQRGYGRTLHGLQHLILFLVPFNLNSAVAAPKTAHLAKITAAFEFSVLTLTVPGLRLPKVQNPVCF